MTDLPDEVVSEEGQYLLGYMFGLRSALVDVASRASGDTFANVPIFESLIRTGNDSLRLRKLPSDAARRGFKAAHDDVSNDLGTFGVKFLNS